MRTTERLLEELNRAFGGDAWYGPALRNLLDGVTEQQATKHPIDGAHSIFELVVHIGTWMDVVAHRIASTDEVLTTVEDWSDVSKASWKDAIEELEHAESRLCDAVARIKNDQWDQQVPGKPHTIHVEVIGALQHNVYHAGQIAILKRAIGIS